MKKFVLILIIGTACSISYSQKDLEPGILLNLYHGKIVVTLSGANKNNNNISSIQITSRGPHNFPKTLFVDRLYGNKPDS